MVIGVPVAVLAVIGPITASVKVMMVPPASHSEAVIHTGENYQAPLLTIVEGLVKRIGSISDLFQSRSCLGHAIGVRAKPRHLIDRRLLFRVIILGFVLAFLLGLHLGVGTIDPKLGKITDCLFHRRPQLFLIRRQSKTGVDRRNPRIGDSRSVLLTELYAITRPQVMRVSVHRCRTGDDERCDTGEDGLLHWNSPLQGPIKMGARSTPSKLHLRKGTLSYEDVMSPRDSSR
jgi:hypothetical protein